MLDPMANPELFVVAMCVLGLTIGSFLNVVASRLPRMMEATWRSECRELLEGVPARETERFDLVRPPSACPACGHRLTVLEKIPIVSYAMLRGRCSACRARISMRYPIVELFGAVVSGWAALHFGPGVEAIAASILGWGLLAASVIDLEARLLPDSITLPLLWLGLGFNLTGTFAPLRDCVIGAIAGYLLLWTVYHGFWLLTGREGMGHGDFKLLAALGAWLGWTALPAVVVFASLACAIGGMALVAFGRASRDTALPFGPYLGVAGLVVLYGGGAVAEAWVQWMTGTT